MVARQRRHELRLKRLRDFAPDFRAGDYYDLVRLPSICDGILETQTACLG